MHARDILKNKGSRVFNAKAEMLVADISRMLHENRIGAVLILDAAGQIAGILSERDIVSGMAKHGAAVTAMTVGSLMTREVMTCQPTDLIADIMATMTAKRIRHLPVVEDGRLLGVISIGDVVKHRLDEAAHEVDSLREYVMTAH
ncbi:MAG: CBS domain-containing protein [Dongiaceae bacterium]